MVMGAVCGRVAIGGAGVIKCLCELFWWECSFWWADMINWLNELCFWECS